MTAIEKTVATLRRTHIVLSITSLGLIVVATRSGPDYQAALHELGAIRSFVSDSTYGRHCAELLFQERADLWEELADLARSDGEIELPDALRIGGTVDCNRPAADATLEQYHAFLVGPSRIDYASAAAPEVLRGLVRLSRSPAAIGPLNQVSLQADGGAFKSYTSEAGTGWVAFVMFVSGLRDAAQRGAVGDSIELMAGFRRGATSDGRSVPIEGSLAALTMAMTPLEWAASEGIVPELYGARSDESVVLPALQPFWESVRAMSLTEVAQYLEARRAEDNAYVELLGLQVDLATLLVAGPLLMLALLTHSFLYLRHLGRLGSTANALRSEPWVALFDDRLSAAAVWTTYLILPGAAIAALYLRSGSATLPVSLWMVSSTCAAVVLGMLSVHSLLRLRRAASSTEEAGGVSV